MGWKLTDIALEDFAKLTSMISAAGLDPTKWQDFVTQLHHVTGGLHVHVSGMDFQSGLYLGITSAGYDPSHLETYEAHYGDQNRWMEGIADKKTGVAYHMEDLWRHKDLKQSEFYNDWIKPQEDISGGGALMMFNDQSRMFVMGGNIRRRDVDKLEENWLKLAGMLAPHLSNALEVNRLLAGKSLETYALEHLGGNVRTAVFATTSNRHVLLANTQAETMLSAGDVVRIDDQRRLSFCGTAENAFLQAVHAFQHSYVFLPRTFEIRERALGPRYLCRLCVVNPEELDHTPTGVLFGPGETTLLITLSQMVASGSVANQLMAQFRLSPMESRVALNVAAGDSIRTIAETNGTSVHTVRNQLKSAMSKMSVNKQLQLARIVEQISMTYL